MTRRGRPRTPDVLTPREWEVLGLIRGGLSNREIADRLGISLAGAKFHVSEIISKLGVQSREEAAGWEGRPRRIPAVFAFTRLLPSPSRLAPAGGVVAVFIVVIALIALAALWRRDGQDDELFFSGTSAASEQQDLEDQLSRRVRAGRLVRFSAGVLTIVDGEGEHSFAVDGQTEVHRGVGREFLVDHDLSRLELDDSLFITGRAQPGGPPLAEVITANVFLTRDGFIAARGPDYMDVHLRLDRLSTEFNQEPVRIWLDQRVSIEWQGAGGLSRPGTRADLTAGSWIWFNGYIAEDEAWVALHIYRSLSQPPPTPPPGLFD